MTGARGSSDGGISEATGESDELEAVDFEAKGRLRYRTVGSFFEVFAVHKFRWYRKTTRFPSPPFRHVITYICHYSF